MTNGKKRRMNISVDKTYLNSDGTCKTKENGTILLERCDFNIEEILLLFDNADVVERFVYGYSILIKDCKYCIRDLYNRTTRKNEDPKDFILRIQEVPHVFCYGD